LYPVNVKHLSRFSSERLQPGSETGTEAKKHSTPLSLSFNVEMEPIQKTWATLTKARDWSIPFIRRPIRKAYVTCNWKGLTCRPCRLWLRWPGVETPKTCSQRRCLSQVESANSKHYSAFQKSLGENYRSHCWRKQFHLCPLHHQITLIRVSQHKQSTG